MKPGVSHGVETTKEEERKITVTAFAKRIVLFCDVEKDNHCWGEKN